ncbi:hypothetical protein CI15_07655 [Paraburkholderia monticola]|uniref:Uncharacterized protein n=1 Tax=Paraburkholderia monticola TaxID=1399968 RepID=A0A149PYK2_9BURK|nr:hypothetical protein [Paraburkholderia monticola]KXU90036.1 hypothetical protein CI15_07655 [Paraburkholderia monticola]
MAIAKREYAQSEAGKAALKAYRQTHREALNARRRAYYQRQKAKLAAAEKAAIAIDCNPGE